MNTSALNLSLLAYFVATMLGVIHVSSVRNLWKWGFLGTLGLGALLNTAAIATRWHDAGRPPFSNMFESMVCFAWGISSIYLILRISFPSSVVGLLSALFACLALAFANTFDTTIEPLVPALQSNWLAFHVMTCFIGYASFAVACAASLATLVGGRWMWLGGKAGPLDTLSYRAIALGFLFLDIGILAGAVWANEAWGTYWSWDPKETWALVTWLIYGVYLHGRLLRGWGRGTLAWISVGGFAAVIFTYYGVNFLLSGLHSYAR